MLDIDAVLEKRGVTLDPIEKPQEPQEPQNGQVEQPSESEQPSEPEQPSGSGESNPPAGTPSEPEFPEERFGGRFKNWEEVQSALNREPESPFKDEYIKKVVDTYNAKGSLSDFFKAHSTDWKSMTPEEVLKNKVAEQYQGLPKKHIESLFEKEKAKYNLDPEDNTEDDIELGRALMERDAEEYRQQKIKEQEGYFQPEPPAVDISEIKQKASNIPQVKNLLEKRTISYKIGDKEFNLGVKDPENILDSLVDERVFINSFIKDGALDVEAWMDVVAYAQDRSGVRQALVDHGKALGKAEIVDNDYKNSTLQGKEPSEGGKGESFMEGLAKAFQQKF